MRIHNARLGFATNSSSSHSLLLLHDGVTVKDDDVANQEFGGNYFTAATRNSKLAYLAAIVRSAMLGLVNDNLARHVAQSLTGISVEEDGYIDHASVIALPRSWDLRGLDLTFLKELSDFLLQERLVILGGSDNDEDVQPPLPSGQLVRPNFSYDTREPLVARKDSRGYWTLFNTITGAKVRLSWDSEAVHADKADAPELVDLKITSYCPHACPYCYQDSTGNGVHADIGRLQTILRALRELEVFEVALGGGEPTAHPRFWELLLNIRHIYEITPNFSTRSIDWLYVPEKAAVVREVCGGFAISCSDDREVDRAVLACKIARIPLDKMSIQYVVGSRYGGAHWVMRSCDTHGVRCTLLGYKTAGRGGAWKPQSDDWVSSYQKCMEESINGLRVGVDTVLAAASAEALVKLKVAPCSYELKDGKFSMYVDAVENVIGPSSYEGERRKLPTEPGAALAAFIKSSFANW